MGVVVRVIRPMVGMIGTGALIYQSQFAASVLVHMTVRLSGRRRSDVEHS